MNRKLLLIIIIVLCSLFTLSCIISKDDYYFPKQLLEAQHENFNLIELDYSQRPNSRGNKNSSDKINRPTDTYDIVMFDYRGQVSHHPVSIAQRCRMFINTYYETKELKYLVRAEKYGQKLMELAKNVNNIPYGEYKFRYAVHTDSSITFESPWYSGMAQGVYLTIFSRLYEITGKEEYLNFADKTFLSFLNPRKNSNIWTVRLDSSNYYWIEEYPHHTKPGRTLNGFIYAIFGLYDYYLVNNNEKVKLIYELGLTTLKHYLPEFRVENDNSFYCLGHKIRATDSYHQLHINQMTDLYRITDDSFFQGMKQQFESDRDAQSKTTSP